MNYAINLNAVLPVRREASEASEQVTQLLFGEYCRVLALKDSFAQIENAFDGYQGWVDKKMLTEISEGEYNQLKSEPIFRTIEPIVDVFCITNKTIYRLSAGSLVPHYNPETSKFEIGDLLFQIHPSFVSFLPEGNIEGVAPTSRVFLNTPYLWGGKNTLGIDCSGFVQVVFSINGISLPRDASQQIERGVQVSLEDAVSGDLLFFEKGRKITHVGIYLGDNRIIHASGKVKIEEVDHQGIKNSFGEYTHALASVKTLRDK